MPKSSQTALKLKWCNGGRRKWEAEVYKVANARKAARVEIVTWHVPCLSTKSGTKPAFCVASADLRSHLHWTHIGAFSYGAMRNSQGVVAHEGSFASPLLAALFVARPTSAGFTVQGVAK